ncbi:TIR domain-containing protein [Actinoplanes sp. NPDC023936]|uniref:TIR domain-containing protein n=1 Tax=Actinoplanes sp. NPDC023936 TaxID=3154910 RepID=UPI0033CB73C4
MPFDGFISYSHAADGRLAPAVQRGLHRLARPWHRRRALWIFRDQTGLAVTPGLWSSIQTALDGSQYFVLLASPEAARSPWVNKEIEHWVTTKSPQRILPVLTDGEWRWDTAAGDFTGDSTAVPDALRGVFAEEPLYLDLRWARDDLHLNLRHARFRDSIAQLAAPMHGVSKDELESEDVRQHRRARRLWSAATATLVALAMVASLTGVLAMRNAGRANAAAVEAHRQQRIASEQRGSAERATEESRRQQQNAQTQEERAQAAAEETRRQERLAGEQRALADEAAAEAATQQENAGRQEENARRQQENARRQGENARRQQENARRAAEDARREQENARRHEEDARRQKENARRQQEDARRNAEDARRQKEDAERQKGNARRAEQEARRQQQLADQAESRAREQEQLARHHQKLAAEATEERQRQEKIAREQEALAREAAEEARRQREEAALQRRIGINQRLVERARAMIGDDPRKALMLGVAAQRLHADAPTKDQLSHLVMSTNYAGALDGVTDVVSVADRVLATADAAGTVSLWNVADPAKPVRLTRLPASGAADTTLAVSTGGQTLAIADGSATATLWNIEDHTSPVRAKPLTDAAGIVAVTFSPDGRTVATSNRDKFTVLWDVPPGRDPVALATLPQASALTFSPDGRTAVTSGAKATVWNLADRAAPVALTTLTGARPGGLVAFNPKLAVVAVEEDLGWMAPWDLRDPAAPRRGSGVEPKVRGSTLTRIGFSPDGLALVLSDSSGTTTLTNFSLGSLPGQATSLGRIATLTGRDGPIRSMSLSPDGQMLFTAGQRGTATLWRIRGAFGRDPIAAFSRPSPADVVGVAFGPDGRSVLAADAPGTAVTWDLTDPAHPVERPAQTLNTGRIQLMKQSPDGRTLAVGGMDEVVWLLDLTAPDGPAVLTTIGKGGEDVSAFTFSPDGQTLAIGRADGTTTLYDLADRSRPATITKVTDRGVVNVITFSADGRTMAVGAGYIVSLWTLADRSAPVRHAEFGTGDLVFAAALSPDGRTLAVGAGFTGSVALWDIADLARPHRTATFQGTDSGTRWLGFSPDGHTLATAGISEARLWEVTDRSTPFRYATLANPKLKTIDLTFSPDGRTLAAGGSRHVTLWDYAVPPDLAAAPDTHACAITGRGLSEEEWNRYIPELPYQPTC